jgi:hypothetical protein
MDFSYNFHQAHNDRLEDAGVIRYGNQNTEGYVLQNDEQPKRHKVVVQKVKQVTLALAQLLVK